MPKIAAARAHACINCPFSHGSGRHFTNTFAPPRESVEIGGNWWTRLEHERYAPVYEKKEKGGKRGKKEEKEGKGGGGGGVVLIHPVGCKRRRPWWLCHQSDALFDLLPFKRRRVGSNATFNGVVAT